MPIITIEVDGSRKANINKVDFILQYLLDAGENGAYVKELYDAWVQLCLKLDKKPGSYKDFRTVVWKLRSEGTIEKFKTESVPNRWDRAYYRIV